ncbi:2-keto-4-pentenoate hydratase [Streptomyces sioyaensis]|uniref:2-keto-4-pentenoate hydratase n=1 Tax=Streptomyces sioyaensis TaxID=67364 RepID=UPI0037D428BE
MPLDVQKAALELIEAEREAAPLEPLTSRWPRLSPDEGYAIQDAALSLRLGRGERIVGVKLGLTSPAKQQRMRVNDPLVAWLTDRMVLEPGARVPVGSLIHPRVEPEIVLHMGTPLAGPGVTREQAAAAVAEVRAGLEVIDSRYPGYRFALSDVIADNASSSSYVLSPDASGMGEVDLRAEACRLSLNGDEVAGGTGADVLGDPLEALVFAANLLGRRGLRIEEGWTVLTGGITDAVPLGSGDLVEAGFSTLGHVALRAA